MGNKMAEGDKKSKGKILVVDDSEDIRMLLALKLRKAEYEVVLASDGMQALEKVDEHPDLKLIILDVMMPVMNGVQVMKFLLDKIEKKIAEDVAKEEGGDGKGNGKKEGEGTSESRASEESPCSCQDCQ